MGALTLHDLHQENLAAMQRVVELGRLLEHPISTSLWSSRADRPSINSGERRYLLSFCCCWCCGLFSSATKPHVYARYSHAHTLLIPLLPPVSHIFFALTVPTPGSKGSLLQQSSCPSSLVDVTALGDSIGLGSSASTVTSFGGTIPAHAGNSAGVPLPGRPSAAAPRDTSTVDGSRDARGMSSRSVRRDGGWGTQSAAGGGGGRGGAASKAEGGGNGGGSGAIISEFALSALGEPGAGGGGGGRAGGGGGRGGVGAAGGAGGRVGRQALSPTARAGQPPGSALSSFASPASWRYETYTKR